MHACSTPARTRFRNNWLVSTYTLSCSHGLTNIPTSVYTEMTLIRLSGSLTFLVHRTSRGRPNLLNQFYHRTSRRYVPFFVSFTNFYYRASVHTALAYNYACIARSPMLLGIFSFFRCLITLTIAPCAHPPCIHYEAQPSVHLHALVQRGPTSLHAFFSLLL